ncbi:ATPase [Candidatus Peregrinibacteria bacterium]|jgi:uncharacterized protein|nr:ATPase [Candidatus Peregrinibacteria bacterium]MBT4632255.1 ATPase [Candidatus Peregrinibacteria bacterium]MBT5516651.1 ATPase [Candidatus Peregrinibacteria bacterium]MBT5824334.1 ATPase [Candidatus Peregrinibacteria bacterium]
MNKHSCHSGGEKKKRFDWILWSTVFILVISYFGWLFFSVDFAEVKYLSVFSESTFDLLNRMAWGMLLGIFFVGLLDRIPRDLIAFVMGRGGSFSGIFRAALAGIMLDLCSHGILLVGMKLYQRGLSLGQTMAFLIASPWNSLSLTLILWALVGLKWTLAFLLLSFLMAVVSGLIFDQLVKRGVLPKNPNTIELAKDFSVKKELMKGLKLSHLNPKNIVSILWTGLKGSRMILRWIFFGTILAAAIRTFVPPESFETLFGPTIGGLGLTLLVATILEVCSEGSTPVAADILTRAGAPGNAFAFLMTGVSTDYTEILAIKETTGRWKTAFFLPLVTLPQVILMAIIMNLYA